MRWNVEQCAAGVSLAQRSNWMKEGTLLHETFFPQNKKKKIKGKKTPTLQSLKN